MYLTRTKSQFLINADGSILITLDCFNCSKICVHIQYKKKTDNSCFLVMSFLVNKIFLFLDWIENPHQQNSLIVYLSQRHHLLQVLCRLKTFIWVDGFSLLFCFLSFCFKFEDVARTILMKPIRKIWLNKNWKKIKKLKNLQNNDFNISWTCFVLKQVVRRYEITVKF